MRTLLREVLVITAASVCLAGAVAAIVVPLAPEAWRRPLLVWGIMLGTAALVASLRRRHWRRR